MRANELWMRCLKARIVSWLNSDRVGATLPLGEGQYVIVAIYENGRYLKPAPVTVPDSLADMANWGPDGPINLTVTKPEDDEDDEDDPDE